MAISKLIFNGVIQMDVTGTTAGTGDVASGETFILADGTQGTGSMPSGVNVPVFTATWNSGWTAIQSVTCNMTFSELYDYIDGGANGGVVVYETNGSETYETIATYRLGSDSFMDFTVMSGGYPSYDIIYSSGGGITTRTPSAAKVTPGTPTASKGAASNHSISVTPSVTNPAGYIDSGTITGTAVTVSASELVSGNLAITNNGTNIDCSTYSTCSVNVSGGGGLVYETGTFEPESDIQAPTIYFANSHTDAPMLAIMADSDFSAMTASSYGVCVIINYSIYCGDFSSHYGLSRREYLNSSNAWAGGNSTINSLQNLQVYVTNEQFKPAGNATGFYFRANRTYNWIAVWAPT